MGLSFHDAAGSGPCMFAAQSGWPVFALDAVEALCVAWTESTGTEGPPWTNGEPARHRARVWIATGMVILALQPETADALAVLRSHAYSSDRTVDALTADLVAGRLTARRLSEDADSGR